MAYIPSHQQLRDHPKLLKAARRLGVPRAYLIGHLQCLWWWALDYAPSGDLAGYDDEDLAAAADWTGDPSAFVVALAECGAGSRDGFLEVTAAGYVLHDWDEYGGKYVEKRVQDAERKRTARAVSPPPEPCPTDVQRTSDGHPEDVRGMSQVEERRGEETREEQQEPPSGAPRARMRDDPPPKTPKTADRRRKRQIPDGWHPDERHHSYARDHGLDLDREAEAFRNHALAAGRTLIDWSRGFDTWLDKARDYRTTAHGARASPQRPPNRIEEQQGYWLNPPDQPPAGPLRQLGTGA